MHPNLAMWELAITPGCVILPLMAIQDELEAKAVAAGTVASVDGDVIIFCPRDTIFEVHLKPANGAFTGPIDKPVRGIVRVIARKVWTVPSGGGFVKPIFGRPRLVQGRVTRINGNEILVEAGYPILVTVPDDPKAISAAEGPIALGRMVSVVAMPGATFELV